MRKARGVSSWAALLFPSLQHYPARACCWGKQFRAHSIDNIIYHNISVLLISVYQTRVNRWNEPSSKGRELIGPPRAFSFKIKAHLQQMLFGRLPVFFCFCIELVFQLPLFLLEFSPHCGYLFYPFQQLEISYRQLVAPVQLVQCSCDTKLFARVSYASRLQS